MMSAQAPLPMNDVNINSKYGLGATTFVLSMVRAGEKGRKEESGSCEVISLLDSGVFAHSPCICFTSGRASAARWCRMGAELGSVLESREPW